MNKSECLNLCDFLDIYFHIFIAYGNIKKIQQIQNRGHRSLFWVVSVLVKQ